MDMSERTQSFSNSSQDEEVSIIEDGGTKVKETFKGTWEIKEFKNHFNSYLENSSKDGTEMCPIRSYFCETGQNIGVPCKWIANLFLYSPDNDNNNNKSQNSNEEDFQLRFSVKLVDVSEGDYSAVVSNSRLRITKEETNDIVYLSNHTQIREMKQREEFALEGQLEWSKLHIYFEKKSSLYLTFELNVYKHPSKWGLSQGALSVVIKFLSKAILSEEEKERFGKEIVSTCQMHKIYGAYLHRPTKNMQSFSTMIQ